MLVPSEATRRLLAGEQGNAERMAIWTRGVDTVLFSPAKRSAALRERWGAGDDRPALVYVGRVSREKGLGLLAPLAARLDALGIAHRLVVVGQGPLLEELRRTLPQAVFTGVLAREPVAEAFASSDLFVFPSRTDTAGNVVLEAQASGLPVVVSADGGPRENMLAEETGAVCGSDDVEEWAQTIAGILRDPDYAAMRARAREYALSRRWEQALEPLYATYRELARPVPAAASARLGVVR